MLSDVELLELAGKAAFVRGRGYAADDRIRLIDADENGLRAEAQGNEIYALWLKREGKKWRWQCDCPAADDGSFCKHLVAAVLFARDDGDEGGAGAPSAPARQRRDDLLDFLRAQPAERLAAWLKAFADGDAEIDKRLHLYRAGDDPATLKTALGKLLNPGGFLDWRRSRQYAQRLDAALEQLESQLGRDADACRTLCEYALVRLFKIYERSDDSAGAIGNCLNALAQLHARACAAAPPGKALAKALFALQQKDGWGILELKTYWPVLGGDGQHAYAKLVAAELETLPKQGSGDNRYGEPFRIVRHAEEYARCAGDFELLQRLLRRDLKHARDYQRVLESLREFGKEREALTWAEDAVKRFPGDGQLREALSECLHAAGLREEALEQTWQAFRLDPDGGAWDALKRVAGKTWPHWRDRALAEIAAREHGEASLRVRLLIHDGDTIAAVALAQAYPVWPNTLHDLARRIERERPPVAGAFYLRIAEHQLGEPCVTSAKYPGVVALLKRYAKLTDAAESKPRLAALRAAHARKSKLMSLMTEAGL
jgi:tetratricopeptide (TPR) repeat protein